MATAGVKPATRSFTPVATISYCCFARLRSSFCPSIKLDRPSPTTSDNIAVGQYGESPSPSRTKLMAPLFWRMARFTRIRCVANKFSIPCCTHPDSRATEDDSGAWVLTAPVFTFLGMTTSILLHCSINQNYSIHWTFCQYLNKIICIAQKGAPVKPQKVVIKKYANRRLYDTSGSRYINLEDVAALVRSGKDLQVVDAKTGQDVTRVTLTQIIVEDAKGQPTGLPLELLRQLIVASDRVGQEF